MSHSFDVLSQIKTPTTQSSIKEQWKSLRTELRFVNEESAPRYEQIIWDLLQSAEGQREYIPLLWAYISHHQEYEINVSRVHTLAKTIEDSKELRKINGLLRAARGWALNNDFSDNDLDPRQFRPNQSIELRPIAVFAQPEQTLHSARLYYIPESLLLLKLANAIPLDHRFLERYRDQLILIDEKKSSFKQAYRWNKGTGRYDYLDPDEAITDPTTIDIPDWRRKSGHVIESYHGALITFSQAKKNGYYFIEQQINNERHVGLLKVDDQNYLFQKYDKAMALFYPRKLQKDTEFHLLSFKGKTDPKSNRWVEKLVKRQRLPQPEDELFLISLDELNSDDDYMLMISSPRGTQLLPFNHWVVLPEQFIITTDRPIYRPGDLVHFKYIQRADPHPRHEKYWTTEEEMIALLFDREQNLILEKVTLQWSSFKTLHGRFKIPEAVSPGEVQILITSKARYEQGIQGFLQDHNRFPYILDHIHCLIHDVLVADYRKADYEARIIVRDSGKVENEEKIIRIEARYLSGEPVAKASISLDLNRRELWNLSGRDDDLLSWNLAYPIKRPYLGEHQWLLDDRIGQSLWHWSDPQQITSKELTTDEKGIIELKVNIHELRKLIHEENQSDEDKFYAPWSEEPMELQWDEVELYATVTDGNSSQTSAEYSLSKGAEYHTEIFMERLFTIEDQPMVTRVLIKDQSLQPLPHQDILISISRRLRRDQVIVPNQNNAIFEGGNHPEFKREFREDWSQVHEIKVRTDEHGKLRYDWKPKPGQYGLYRVRVQHLNGQKVSLNNTQWIYTSVLPGKATDHFPYFPDLAESHKGEWESICSTDQLVYDEGEIVTAVIINSEPVERSWLLIPGLKGSKLLPLSGRRYEIVQFPAPKVHNNSFFRVISISDVGINPELKKEISPEELAEYKDKYRRWAIGQMNICVHPSSRHIKVKLTTDQSQYRPGSSMKIQLSTTTQGQPLPAELEIAVVDEAIYQIQQDETPLLIKHFTGMKSRYDYPEGDLITNGLDPILWHHRISSGCDGCFMDDSESIVASTRKNFRDTAYYKADLVTNQQGQASIEIPLPDDLTRWRIVVRAVGKDAQFGNGRSQVLTQMPVTVRMGGSRFYTEGDRPWVTSIVSNNTDQDGKFRLKFSVQGATLPKGHAPVQTFKLSAGETRSIYWPIEVSNDQELVMTSTLDSTLGQDRIQQRIPVYPNAILRQLDLSTSLQSKTKLLINPPAGLLTTSPVQLMLNLNQADARSAINALPYLKQYPYGCTEQTMSRFLPALAIQPVIKKHQLDMSFYEVDLPKIMDQAILKLAYQQKYNGAWGWWSRMSGDPWMTAYVLWGLSLAQEQEHQVPTAMTGKGLQFLYEIRDKIKPEHQAFVTFVLRRYRPALHFHDFRSLEGVHFSESKMNAGKKTELRTFAFLIKNDDKTEAQVIYLDASTLKRLSNKAFKARHHSAEQVYDFALDQTDIIWLVLAGYEGLKEALPDRPQVYGAIQHSIQYNALTLLARHQLNPQDPTLPVFANWLLQQRIGDQWRSTLDTGFAVMALGQLPIKQDPVYQVHLDQKQVTLNQNRVTLLPDFKAKTHQLTIQSNSDQAQIASIKLQYYCRPEALLNQAVMQQPVTKIERELQVFQKGKWISHPQDQALKLGQKVRMKVTLQPRLSMSQSFMIMPLLPGMEVVKGYGKAEETDAFVLNDYSEVTQGELHLPVPHLEAKQRSVFYQYFVLTQAGSFTMRPIHLFDMYQPEHESYSQVNEYEIKP